MKKEITNIFLNVLNINEENFEKTANSKDSWDSLAKVEIVFAIEDAYDISFEQDELATFETPFELLEATMKKVGSQ